MHVMLCPTQKPEARIKYSTHMIQAGYERSTSCLATASVSLVL